MYVSYEKYKLQIIVIKFPYIQTFIVITSDSFSKLFYFFLDKNTSLHCFNNMTKITLVSQAINHKNNHSNYQTPTAIPVHIVVFKCHAQPTNFRRERGSQLKTVVLAPGALCHIQRSRKAGCIQRYLNRD